ncbi:MAG: flp pilus-assembly TadE/G-like family protein [Propionibacteriaceae bacterium]|jgi:secretion/DNA translocation related TadE-like protein|nr:flp pilus-assembly TadE/G-like family protein [Propionibacteriaceae bacterium]
MRDEKGSGTIITAIALMLCSVLAAGAFLAYGLVDLENKLQGSADLVALSAARAKADGQDACKAAKEAAKDNSVRLADCEEAGDALDFAVSVEVEIDGWNIPGLPEVYSAQAEAGYLSTLEAAALD